MIARFLNESIVAKKNDKWLLELIKRTKFLGAELERGTIRMNLLDGKPGSYFVIDCDDDNEHLVWFSYSRVFFPMKQFGRDFITWLSFKDGDSSVASHLDDGFSFGNSVELKDKKACLASSAFARKTLKSISNITLNTHTSYTIVSSLEDHLKSISAQSKNVEWGKS